MLRRIPGAGRSTLKQTAHCQARGSFPTPGAFLSRSKRNSAIPGRYCALVSTATRNGCGLNPSPPQRVAAPLSSIPKT
jgi:hypothetical protein